MFSKEASGGRNGGTAWLRGWHGQLRSPATMRKMPLVLAFALMITAATMSSPQASIAKTGLKARGCVGPGAQLRAMLMLPAGEHGYLRAYRTLFNFFFGPSGIVKGGPEPWGSALAKMRAAPKAMAAFRTIEEAILRGCKPDSLYQLILRTVRLTGNAEAAGKNSLADCSLINRVRLAYVYEHVAEDFVREGKKHRAYDAFRCWLFLLSQEVGMSRLIWCDLEPVAVSKYGMPPKVFRSIRRYCRTVYAGRVHFDRLLSAIPTVGPGGRNSAGSLKRLSASLHTAWSAARAHTLWQYQVLQEMRAEVRRAAAANRGRVAKLLQRTLVGWRREVRAERYTCALRRRALFRWIKEAMGP